MFGISIDSPQRHAAWIEKLMLPFPLLSDPDRSAAIVRYGVADEKDDRNIARPAIVIVAPSGVEALRVESRDFADRPVEDEVIAALEALGLPATTQAAPRLGPAEPGPAAFRFDQMVPYYRGARFAAVALGRRFPEARGESDAYVEQMDRYTEAAKALYKARQ